MKNVSKMRTACLGKLGGSLLAITVAAGLVAPTAAWAQTSESTLRGTAPAGATVVAKSVDTGAVRQTTAGPDGTYVIVGLPSGSYHVVVGGNQSGDVDLSVASVSVLDFGSARSESADKSTIVVTGKRQSVEVHSSQVNQIVSLHDIAALPQATRNFLEFADSVPGMAFNVDEGHNTSLRGGAQLDSAVNVYIDGVSQKDFVGSGGGTGGSGSGFSGSGGSNGNGDPGNPFPQLAIGEYKVITSNYSAEYGDAASAVVVAQTKSGTNKFHGEVFGDYTDEHLRASRPDEYVSGKAHQPSKEYGVAFSGPIVKDVAHFFATWEHKSLADYASVYTNGTVPTAAIAVLPSNVASQLNTSVTNPFVENLYFGKIDIEPSAQDRIELTGSLRIESNMTGAGGQNGASVEVPYKNDVKHGDLHWQHSGDHWVNEFRVAYQDANSSAVSTTAAPQFQYAYYPNLPTATNANQNSAGIINVGGPGSGVGAINRQKGWTFADDVTFSNLHFAGDHTLKFGSSFASINLTTQNASSDLANATYSYAVYNSGTLANPVYTLSSTPWQVQYPNLTAGYNGASVTTNDKQFSAYAQDNWDVNRKLSLSIGLRVDHEVVPAYLNYVTGANVVAALASTPAGWAQSYAATLATNEPGAPGINIANYVSTGSNRSAPWNFSPRLGFNYDVHEDGSFVLFGGYARAYNRNLFSTLALETTKIALNGNPQVFFPSAQTQDSFGPCATAANVNPTNHCYAWDPSYLTPGGLAALQTSPTSHEVDLMNNNIKTPYSDQFSLGIRNKLGDWNTQATLSYVASYDGIYGHWGARYSNGQFYQGGSQWGAQGVPGVGSLILWDNGFKDQDLQFSLAAQKPYTKVSGWSATVSYTLSSAKQNNAYPYGAAGNMYLFDYPIAADYPMIKSTAVPTSRLVITGSRDLPWNFQIAGKLALATPQFASTIYGCNTGVPGCNPNNSIGGGTGGVAVARPSDLLGYKDLDFQLTKNLTFGSNETAYVRVDVLNLFNWHNWDPAAIQFSNNSSGVPVSAHYNTNMGPIVGQPFTLKFSAGMKF